jgi:predicted O-linked N-acetylglucosamine transferase (SPINDLY family)
MKKTKKVLHKNNFDTQKLKQLEQIALSFLQSNDLTQAKHFCQQIVKVDPKNAEANHYLGIIAHQTGNNALAERLIRKALLANPDMQQAYNNMGVVLKEQGKFEEAKKNYLKLIVVKPDYVEAHNNLGVIYKELGETEEAIRSLNRAIELNPSHADAYNVLGATYRSINKIDDAIFCFEKTIELLPNYAEAHYNLGNSFFDKEDYNAAIMSYSYALKLKPNYAEAHRCLGIVLEKNSLFDDAKHCFDEACRIQPNHPAYMYYVAHNLHARGEYQKAYDCYQKVLKLDPNHAFAHSNLLSMMNYRPEYSNQEIFEQHSAWEKQIIANRSANRPRARRCLNSKGRRIKVAYISPDFRNHSVSYFFIPLLSHHDTEKFETYCYYNNTIVDGVTESIKAQTEHWRDINKVSDVDVVKQIIKDDIDILVDLAGHTGESRLPVFTYRPAPIQVTWLGYPNTTGLSDMDYRLTDEQADPEGASDPYYSEQLIRLPHGFLCYQGDDTIEYKKEPPFQKNGYITFGSFNNLTKVTSEVIAVWANILKEVPTSRLLLKSKQLLNEAAKTMLLTQFKELGIESERIVLRTVVDSYQGHLEVYNQVDIGLDPFPYNGTTTTLEGLWMGVPVVTLCGDRHASRVGSSILHRVGLDNLIANDFASYIDIAQKLANDVTYLQSLRAEMRERLRNSDLCNPKQFAHDVEESYLAMVAKTKAC